MADFASYLKSRRQEILDKDASMNSFENIYFSGTTYSMWKGARNITSKYSTGTVIDAGSGRGGWCDIILENADKREGEKLDWVADLTNMPDVPTERFDAVVCHQILEHVSEPGKAFSENGLVLKTGGCFVLSVPHDYFRYTPNGIAFMAEQYGFEVEELTTYGGIFTFIHHQFSTVIIGLASVTKITGKLVIYNPVRQSINKLQKCYLISEHAKDQPRRCRKVSW